MILKTKEELKNEFVNTTNQYLLSNDDATDYLIKKLENEYLITQFNSIYVYMGTYKSMDSSDIYNHTNNILTDENDPNAEYKLYYELDTGLPKCVDLNENEYFENNNTIIFIPNVRNVELKFTFEEDFNKLRRLYFKELFIYNEETAISLVTSEVYIKQVFSIENYMKEKNISLCFYEAFVDAAICNNKSYNKSIVLKRTKKN